MLPWSFSEEGAAEKHMAQLQHNMWVTNAKAAALSIIPGGGKWVEIAIVADPLYQHLLLAAEKKFWRCVESGEPPRLFGVEPPSAGMRLLPIGTAAGYRVYSSSHPRSISCPRSANAKRTNEKEKTNRKTEKEFAFPLSCPKPASNRRWIPAPTDVAIFLPHGPQPRRPTTPNSGFAALR